MGARDRGELFHKASDKTAPAAVLSLVGGYVVHTFSGVKIASVPFLSRFSGALERLTFVRQKDVATYR